MTTAGELRSGKGHRDENFPVASVLIDARHGLKAADDVIRNYADMSAIREQVATLHNRYLELAQQPRA